MLVDSHCHLDFPELAADLPEVLRRMADAGVGAALCPGVSRERLPTVLALAGQYANIYAGVGVHPDSEEPDEFDVDALVELAGRPKVLAIGETGLDYFRLTGDPEVQRQRFRRHIEAALRAGKPLIVHTRAAKADTLRILREAGADRVGGVFHCFTEDRETAWQAVDMGFHISFSGIVTFKNAQPLRDLAAELPLPRLLVETDSPYLAPTPHRGKINQPAYVAGVAAELARVRGVSVAAIAEATTANFCRLFRIPEESLHA